MAKTKDDNEARASRLRIAREQDGRFKRAAAAARALDMPEPTYQAHEGAARGFSARTARRYADFYSVSLDWLLTGRGTSGNTAAPIIGVIGHGGEIAQPFGFKNDQTEPQPQGHTDCVAARVQGDHNFPLRDGWLIFWRRNAKDAAVPDSCIGHLCVAKIKDGPLVLKEIRRTRTSKFDLFSWNSTSRESVALEWAAKIVEIRPK